MSFVCPTVTAYDLHEYRAQIERVQPFAKRIHVDLMDGEFAPTKSPDIKKLWLPKDVVCDIHLMYKKPMEQLEELFKMQPDMVIVHAEADVDFVKFTDRLQEKNIKIGLALLPETTVESVHHLLHIFDQVLLFSGNLGHHGGQADLSLLSKINEIHEYLPLMEIAWDGGINTDNATQLVDAGVNVLNVGGFIQKSDTPQTSYNQLVSLLKAGSH